MTHNPSRNRRCNQAELRIKSIRYTYPFGLNNRGQIVGWFYDATQHTHGFLKDGTTFTTIDVPGALSTIAYGINTAGQIVGSFQDATGFHGFLKDGATFTTIDGPGATDVPGAAFTEARGINTAGRIVGFFEDATGGFHGFLATPER
jgi:probable HAF family extracellular repeat protein